MEHLDVGLGLFACAAPHNASALLMHFEHVFGGPFLGKAEDDLKYVSDVTHEVDRIIVDDDVPR